MPTHCGGQRRGIATHICSREARKSAVCTAPVKLIVRQVRNLGAVSTDMDQHRGPKTIPGCGQNRALELLQKTTWLGVRVPGYEGHHLMHFPLPSDDTPGRRFGTGPECCGGVSGADIPGFLIGRGLQHSQQNLPLVASHLKIEVSACPLPFRRCLGLCRGLVIIVIITAGGPLRMPTMCEFSLILTDNSEQLCCGVK